MNSKLAEAHFRLSTTLPVKTHYREERKPTFYRTGGITQDQKTKVKQLEGTMTRREIATALHMSTASIVKVLGPAKRGGRQKPK